MTVGVEKWTLTVMLIAACVLLIGEALDGDWLMATGWLVAVVLVGVALRRRRRQSA